MNNDPFSDIIKLTQAQSLVTGGFTAGGQWALRFPAPEKIKFFAIVKGSWVMLEGEPAPVRFSTGDVGLLSAKRSFILASHPDVEPVDAPQARAAAGFTPPSHAGQTRHQVRARRSEAGDLAPAWQTGCPENGKCLLLRATSTPRPVPRLWRSARSQATNKT